MKRTIFFIIYCIFLSGALFIPNSIFVDSYTSFIVRSLLLLPAWWLLCIILCIDTEAWLDDTIGVFIFLFLIGSCTAFWPLLVHAFNSNSKIDPSNAFYRAFTWNIVVFFILVLSIFICKDRKEMRIKIKIHEEKEKKFTSSVLGEVVM
jgi:hypothetical protein